MIEHLLNHEDLSSDSQHQVTLGGSDSLPEIPVLGKPNPGCVKASCLASLAEPASSEFKLEILVPFIRWRTIEKDT